MELTTCPECGAPAHIEHRHVLESTDGPIEHAKIRCVTRPLVLPVGHRARRGRRTPRGQAGTARVASLRASGGAFLGDRVAAVDDQHLPGRVGRAGRAQHRHDGGDLVGGAAASDRGHGGLTDLVLGLAGGGDPAGGDDVAGDARRPRGRRRRHAPARPSRPWPRRTPPRRASPSPCRSPRPPSRPAPSVRPPGRAGPRASPGTRCRGCGRATAARRRVTSPARCRTRRHPRSGRAPGVPRSSCPRC